MRRVPVDEEFGSPIAALRNSPVILFGNGTIAKINDSKDEKNPLMFKHYSFYYENVSQITHLKLNSKEEISPLLNHLTGYRFKIAFTIILTIILGFSYQFSIDYSQLPII